MKKLFILTALACIAANGAYAYTCSELGLSGTCYAGSAGIKDAYIQTNSVCQSSSSGCTYRDCNNVCSCNQRCTGDLDPNLGCPAGCPNTVWDAIGGAAILKNMYQSRCVDAPAGIIGKNCEWRCADGYYGTAKGTSDSNPTATTMSGCTVCPTSGGLKGTSVAGDNATITKCYIPSGTSFSDSTGSGTYSNNCYWTN